MEAPGARIIRPVTTESIRDLRPARRIRQNFPNHIITPREPLRVTLVENGELTVLHRRNKVRDEQAIRNTLESTPETGSEKMTLPVIGVNYYGTSLSRRALAITLGDPDGVFEAERQFFKDQLPRRRFKFTEPHISLANLHPHFATSDMANWVHSQLPETVTLSPVRIINPEQISDK